MVKTETMPYTQYQAKWKIEGEREGNARQQQGNDDTHAAKRGASKRTIPFTAMWKRKNAGSLDISLSSTLHELRLALDKRDSDAWERVSPFRLD